MYFFDDNSHKMEESEMWGVHSFLYTLAEYEDVDFDGTEYDEHNVGPTYIHKKKGEHKEAVRLLSKLLEEETELVDTHLESWKEGYNHDDYNEGDRNHKRKHKVDWENPVGK